MTLARPTLLMSLFLYSDSVLCGELRRGQETPPFPSGSHPSRQHPGVICTGVAQYREGCRRVHELP